MQLRVGVPIWLSRATNRQRPHYSTLNGWLDAEVVIVGGGITGAGIAQVFAQAGLDVALVEAGMNLATAVAGVAACPGVPGRLR